MTRRFFVPTLIVVGMILVLLGVVWPSVAPPTLFWSEDQAREYSNAFAALHAASITGSHPTSVQSAHQFIDAQQRFADIKADLDHARSMRERTGTYIATGGLAILLAAVAIYQLTSRQA